MSLIESYFRVKRAMDRLERWGKYRQAVSVWEKWSERYKTQLDAQWQGYKALNAKQWN